MSHKEGYKGSCRYSLLLLFDYLVSFVHVLKKKKGVPKRYAQQNHREENYPLWQLLLLKYLDFYEETNKLSINFPTGLPINLLDKAYNTNNARTTGPETYSATQK